MNIEQGKSRKNPLGPACMSEINGIIAEARTKEPFPIGSHEGEYFDRGYRGSAAQQAFNQRVIYQNLTHLVLHRLLGIKSK